MSVHMKIQPINGDVVTEALASTPIVRQPRKSLLTKLFERQSTPKDVPCGKPVLPRDNSGELEPSSFALRNMVESYMEDPKNEKAQQRCGGLKMCFGGSGTDSSDDESSDTDLKRIKGLVRCTSSHERNLMINATSAVEKTTKCLYKEDTRLQIVYDSLLTLGYDASICISSWEDVNPINCLAEMSELTRAQMARTVAEFKYIEVLIGGERLVIDLDFKSKFEIARPTRTYKKILKSLPCVFVGKIDRLVKLVIVVSDAAKKSFKKRKLHVAPWRRAEYVLTKWLSPYIRQGRQTNGEGSSRNQTTPRG